MTNEVKKGLNDAIIHIENAEKLLANILGGALGGSKEDPVIEDPSSVQEPEPSGEITKEPFTETEPKEYRDDLKCPHCDSIVYDNRPKINSGEYSKGSPHFKCSNDKDCSARVPKDNGGFFGKGWWTNSSDLPQQWLDEEKLIANDGREIDRPVAKEPSDDKESPF